jgi:hypothetical protein
MAVPNKDGGTVKAFSGCACDTFQRLSKSQKLDEEERLKKNIIYSINAKIPFQWTS